MIKLRLIALLFFSLFCLCNVSAATNPNWSTLGAGLGNWINTIHVAKNGVLYAGTDVSGIYKSTDKGVTYSAVNKGLTNYHVIALASDPTNSSTIYAGTRGGFFKSTNGGNTWKSIRSGIGPADRYKYSAPISAIAIDPKSPRIVYAGVGNPRGPWYSSVRYRGSIYKSTNFGETFAKINASGIGASDEIHGLVIDPKSTNILYAATSVGIYKSTNGGRNWVKKSNGLSGKAQFILIDPKNPQRLFATKDGGSVYRSTNGGNSWARFANGLPTGKSNFDWLAKDPNKDVIYVAGNVYEPRAAAGVWKSVNGGAWQLLTRWNSNMAHGWYGSGIRVTALANDPSNPSRIYFSGTTTLYKTENGGGNWSQIYTKKVGNKHTNRGLGVHGATHTVAIDPKNAARIYMDSGDHGLFRSEDRGKSWQRSNKGLRFAQHIYDIIIDPVSSVVYISDSNRSDTNRGGVAKSTDFGSSWKQISSGLPTAAVFSLGMDVSSPVNARVLYAGFKNKGDYRSTNGGASWSAFNNGIPGNARVYVLRSAPDQPKTIYAGIGSSSSNGGLYRSVNGGRWQKVNTSTALPQMRDIAFDPKNPKIMYVATGRVDSLKAKAGVWKNTNGGAGAWKLMLEDHEMVKSIAIDPNNSSKIYAATFTDDYYDEAKGTGPWMSTDGGQNWTNIKGNLPQERAEKIIAYPSNPATVYVGSFGLYRLAGTNQVPVGNNVPVVANANQAPVANGDMATVSQGGTVSIRVLANDTDADGSINSTSVVVVKNPSSGTMANNGNGVLIYKNNGATTSDSFRYTVADNQGKVSNSANVNIVVLTGGNNAPTVTTTGTTNGGGGSTGSGGNTTTVNNTSAQGLVGHWRLDEAGGGIAIDSSGNGNDGRVNGAVWTSGFLRGALDFDGQNDYVDLGPLDIPGTKLTITAWINADRFNHLSFRDSRIVSKATSTANQGHCWMLSTVKQDATTRLRFRVKTNDTTTVLVASSAGLLTPGVWIHVAGVYDGTDMRLYQDGIGVGRISKTGNLTQDAGADAWIGDNPNGSRPFDGVIDDVRIYNRALTQTEIADIVNNGTGN